MPFVYERTVRLADTDAAGVVFFARTLSICHEAYEAALAAGGIDLNVLLGANGIVVPIARSEADYIRPLLPGDKLHVSVVAKLTSETRSSLRYEITRSVHRQKSPRRSAPSTSARRPRNANALHCRPRCWRGCRPVESGGTRPVSAPHFRHPVWTGHFAGAGFVRTEITT